MAKYVVAVAGDIPPGARKVVTIGGRDIVVFNIGGTFHGLLDRCPHNGGSLCKGTLTRRVQSDGPGHYATPSAPDLIRCPWHGWQFDVATGQSWCEPERARTVTYPVEVAAGRDLLPELAEGVRVDAGVGGPVAGDLVPGPLTAETVPVTVEQDYVVVEA